MNKKKNILIVSYSYPPSNAPAAQRPYSLAKYLNKSKYNVTVITCSNADSSLGIDYSDKLKLDNVKLIKIHTKFQKYISTYRPETSQVTKVNNNVSQKFKSFIFKIGSKLIIPDKAAFWHLNVKKYLNENNNIIETTDCLITTSPLISNHILGNYIKSKKKHINWIADFRDFHYLENWFYSKKIFSLYHKIIEKKIIKNSDSLTFVSLSMKKSYETFYDNYKYKMNVIYNGFDCEDFIDQNINNEKNKKLTIFYAGSFYNGIRSPLPLLSLLDNAIESGIINNNKILIKIAGNIEHKILEETKKFKSYSCINYMGKIPRSEVLIEMRKSNVLWLIIGNKKSHYKSIPLKFFEYLASNKPILNFAPALSESTMLIDKYNLGWNFENSIDNNDFLKFNKILNDFKFQDYKLNISQEITNYYTRKNQTKLFELLIDD